MIYEFWRKYKLVIIVVLTVILLFAGTSMYYRHKVSVLRQQLIDKKIEHVLEIDRLKSGMIKEELRRTDSLLQAQQLRYDSLLNSYTKTKKSYEKALSDYSDIIIERPEY